MTQRETEWSVIFRENLWKIVILSVSALVFTFIVTREVPEGLTPKGLKALAIFSVSIIFWITNVIPLMITSLLAVVLFPLMGVIDSSTIFSFFGNKAVFFILGAFILASSIIRSGLSARIAMLILVKFGTSPQRLIGVMLLLPAFMSFWMSEHAVAALLFPITNEIAKAMHLVPGKGNYGKALYLANAWGCIIGGIATLLGGARAALALGILYENTGKTITFMQWMAASLPTVILLLFVAYYSLKYFFIRNDEIDISVALITLKKKVRHMGRITRKEIATGILMILTIFGWVFFGHSVGLADIALIAVVIAFIFNLMDWNEVEEDVNWGVFLMYGGAITLGYAMEHTGASRWLADNSIGNYVTTPSGLLFTLVFVSIILTEAISNSAVITFLLPLSLSLANYYSLDPILVTLAVAIPSGLGFTLPMGTPAITLAFSSGYFTVKDVAVPGLILNLISWIIFCLSMIYYWPLIGLKIL